MCGIVGIWLKNESALVKQEQLKASINSIKHRGPDSQNFKVDANIGLAHARLSVIDLSANANQPMTDESGRYTLVFNGEIYNHKDLINNLPSDLIFKSSSDTEVLLQYIIHFGLSRLEDLNGFFSFLFYDNQKKELLFARDRYGIKPLMVYEDSKQIVFASELSAFFNFDIDKSLDYEAINLLFQLTYIPAPYTILNNAKSILPGHSGSVKNGKIKTDPFYAIDSSEEVCLTYKQAVEEVKTKVEEAVKRRLMSDVPLGTFLSGGIDSSVISLVAKQNKIDLKTFSIGFKEAYFDESEYALEMAKAIDSQHHQIQLSRDDFKEKFNSFLSLNHQPFADSSAFAVYLLSQKTKAHVTVCLSGDGADELFGGYRKHEAEFKIRQLSSFSKRGIKLMAKLLHQFPKGRHGKWSEFNRRLQKVNNGLDLSKNKRFWQWLTFIEKDEKKKILKKNIRTQSFNFNITEDLNSMFRADQLFVLPNDMLTKVDRMSMSHGLEVRTPFLDHELVDFVNRLPANYKLNKNGRKQILIDAFKDQLPEKVYNREKKGFEIPLFEWFKEELESIFDSEVFSESYINEQGIFNYNYIFELRNHFKSAQFGDKIYLVWTLIIFQNWWHKNIWK